MPLRSLLVGTALLVFGGVVLRRARARRSEQLLWDEAARAPMARDLR